MSVSEAAAAASPGIQAAPLAAGLETVDNQQQVTFTSYTRKILPLDGWAFWVLSSLLDPPPESPTVSVKGSLHYSSDNTQDEAERFAVNRVVFTSETEVEALTSINPETIYIGNFDGQLFSFSNRRMLYRQAGLFHYQGDAVYPSMATQIVNSLDDLDLTDVVVSNSLPLWLGLNAYCPMYPSFLVPDNITPPWCAVHVVPGSTRAIAAAPTLDADNDHYQLMRERVRLTFYGLRNNAALDFQDYVNDYTLNTENFGIANMPGFKDEKKTQSELNILAQAKTIEYDINYYQTRVRDAARQLILSAFATFYSKI